MASSKNGCLWNAAGAHGGTGFSLMSLVLCCVILFSSTVFLMSSVCDAADACLFYHIVDNEWRDVASMNQTSTSQCDKGKFLRDEWYAFTINGERAQIPTECIKNDMCGSKVPMRVNLLGQSLPENHGENVTAVLCSSYNILGRYDCCVLRTEVVIAKCDDTYVYQFAASFDRCPVAVCAQKMDEPLPMDATAKMGQVYPGTLSNDDKEEVVEEDDEADDTTTEQASLVFGSANKTDDPTELTSNTTQDSYVSLSPTNLSQDPGNSSIEDPGSSLSGLSKPETTAQAAQNIMAAESLFDDQNSTFSDSNQTQSMDPDAGEKNQNISDSMSASANMRNTTKQELSHLSSSYASTLEDITTNTSLAAFALDSNATLTPKPPVVSTTPLSSALTSDSAQDVSTFVNASGSNQQPSPLPPIHGQSLSTTQSMTNTTTSTEFITTTTIKQKTSVTPDTSTDIDSTDGTTKFPARLPPVTSSSPLPTTEVPIKITSPTYPTTTGTTLFSTSVASSSSPSTQTSHPSSKPNRTSTSTDDVVFLEKVRLVFKGDQQAESFPRIVYSLLESFLRRATIAQRAKDGSEWWFRLYGNDETTSDNSTTYMDFQINHTSQEEILVTFDRLQLDNFFAVHANLTLLTVCRPSKNCQVRALASKSLPSVFEDNAPVFIAVITLCAFCVIVMIIGMVCARYRRRGSYVAEDDNLDIKNSDNNHFLNANPSPFTDEQIMKDEVADTPSFNGSAMDGDTHDNTWVIPLEDAPAGGDATAKATEDTKL